MNKILIANRGEIACRIMQTARRMGIKTVAVYSDVDRQARHVRMADEAVCIGPAPSAQSYLRDDVIIEAALRLGADGIHPGYGFLSENAAFARAVTAAGLIFIGPSPESMEIMGSKLAAKQAVAQYGIPMVPGTDRAVNDPDEAIQIARQIGFPILIKASAGGGGKGMRVVQDESELADQMQRAISEALSAFGDGAVFIEKFVTKPRHIEIQILADNQGNCVHLFERECSVQRRHQKVIEEAPSSILTPAVRAAMGAHAVQVARAARYSGAGTVEFLVDDQMNYYFLEMNTRLQVEHPVTEWITGLDLVEQQIRVARGEALAFKQEDLKIHGHAIELRVCAEEPLNDFLPGTGTLTVYKPPAGPYIRVDDGFYEGAEVPIYYDPLLAKLIAWGPNRMAALDKLIDAIEHFEVVGVPTTLDFGRWVLEHPAFRNADFDTHFINKHFDPQALSFGKDDEALAAAQLALMLYLENKKVLKVPQVKRSAWSKR